MTRQQAYPSSSKTRAVYPPIAIARQTLIKPNIVRGGHNEWYEYMGSPGSYGYVVDNLRTEYIYVWIWSSYSSTVVLSNPVLGRVEINVGPSGYSNVFRSGGQPINIEITFTNGESYIYLCEGILFTGEIEVIRFRPRARSEFLTIHGDDVIAGCTQALYIEIFVPIGDVEFYVNGEYYSRAYLVGTFTLDKEIVITARGNGFIYTHYTIYPERIVLDVDTAYIDPCPHYCYVYENDINYYDTPCIYRNPAIEFNPEWSEEELIQILVLEINNQIKEYIDVNRYKEEICF
ncbi:MAG: hypothetical protein QW215_09050 [Ignisphaera sp.]